MIFKSKRGIGILEVMVAALVLGILYAAVSNLQKGNRDALLRIRGRDGATEVAQNVIDSLGALGLASFTDDNLVPCTDAGGATIANCYTLAKLGPDGSTKIKQQISVTRTWEGQPGIVSHDITVPYTVDVKFSGDNDPVNDYRAKTSSLLLGVDSITHVYAKRVDVIVSWPFKNSMQSITVSGVIR